MPTFTMPITPPHSLSPSSPPRAGAAPPSPPRSLSPTPESHPDCRACKRKSPSPHPQPEAKKGDQPKPQGGPKSTSNVPKPPQGIFAHLCVFAGNYPLIAFIIGLPLAITFLIYLPLLFTSLTPMHYLFPESLPLEAPHPDDMPAAAGAQVPVEIDIAAQIEAAMLRAVGADPDPQSPSPLLFPPIATSSPSEAPLPAAVLEEVPLGPGTNWISFTSYLIIQLLLTTILSSSTRRLLGYWLTWPLHNTHKRHARTHLSVRSPPYFGGVDPSPRLMTIWFFVHPRKENISQILRTSLWVMISFCGIDSYSSGDFGTWMDDTLLGQIIPFGTVVYFSLVGVVLLVNQWKLVCAVGKDICRKFTTTIWGLVKQWGILFKGLFWTFEGVVFTGVVFLGVLVMYTLARPFDDDSWWEPIRSRFLVTTSDSVMSVVDVLFDWAGVGVRCVVAEFRAPSMSQPCCRA